MKQILSNIFEKIISSENLLLAWQEFVKGKRNKIDVQKFSAGLADNIVALHVDLLQKIYRHGPYQFFRICDPKPRDIHKASVRDRLLHHAVYRVLYPYFEPKFIFDSYSCRLGKGTHRAIKRFRSFSYKVSKNNTKTCWVLQGDIRKFFASINHQILIKILQRSIKDQDLIWLLNEIIKSFNVNKIGIGLPLGNLTSQLLTNVYLNELDQFVKHQLKIKYYIRYADDFVIMLADKKSLTLIILKISDFLKDYLDLILHPDKIKIKTLVSGIDFLGWINFFDYCILRTKTKKRMLKKMADNPSREIINSYLGLISHGNTHKLEFLMLVNIFGFDF